MRALAMLSSGVQNLLKLVGGWAVAFALVAANIVYFDEIRTALGLKLEPADFGMAASPPEPAKPEVRTIIQYVERPRDKDDDADRRRPAQSRSRSSFAPSVELKRQRDGHFHAEAYVNGRPVQVLVDTGATLVALSYEDARAAGVSVGDSDFTMWSSTANGRARFAPVMLDDVRIGDVTVRNVRAAVSEPGKLSTTLLGMSFLGQTRMQMQGGTLVLER
jgi:aspartyl protease family protein